MTFSISMPREPLMRTRAPLTGLAERYEASTAEDSAQRNGSGEAAEHRPWLSASDASPRAGMPLPEPRAAVSVPEPQAAVSVPELRVEETARAAEVSLTAEISPSESATV